MKDAPAIIWDLRGNGGGYTSIALAILGGRIQQPLDPYTIATRIPGSTPPAFEPVDFVFQVTPNDALAYGGKVAILTDGICYSACDLVSCAAKQAKLAVLVGQPTAGGFGTIKEVVQLPGSPAVWVSIDDQRTLDLQGVPLETHSVQPDLLVDYDPDDVAAGVDTMPEAAATYVKSP